MTDDQRGSGRFVLREARAGDRPDVEALLRDAGLPLEGVGDHFDQFAVVVDGERVVGAAGLELYGETGLLRSLVIHPDWRGRGAGVALTERLVAVAVDRGVLELYLLTTTAPRYFERFGFKPFAREALPAALNASAELRGACPDTAAVLRLELKVDRGRR